MWTSPQDEFALVYESSILERLAVARDEEIGCDEFDGELFL